MTPSVSKESMTSDIPPVVSAKPNRNHQSLSHLREGTLISGDCGSSHECCPSWLDKEKFRKASDVFHKYFFSIFFSHLAGLMLVVYLPNMLPPLLSTGNSGNVICLFRRYLGTLVHVRQWYEGDIWNPEDPAHKSIIQVRQMHKKVSDKMNASTKTGSLYVSQYDMALTQFAFIGFAILYPRKIGIHCSKEELECLIHFWRGVGYLLGIEDRFNLCIGNYESTVEVCQDIVDEALKPAISMGNKESALMSRQIVQAMNSFIIFLSWEALAHFWFDNIKLKWTFKSGAYEYIGYYLMNLTFGVLLKFRMFHDLFNYLLRNAIRDALEHKNECEGFLSRYHSLNNV